jgi:hypothetical protein
VVLAVAVMAHTIMLAREVRQQQLTQAVVEAVVAMIVVLAVLDLLAALA